MASDANYCLQMNRFEENGKIYWQELQMEKTFYDVTLACEDKQIMAHKLIISSCSPAIRNILKSNFTRHPVIYFRRVKYRDLQNLLNFMYHGDVAIAEESLSSFLEIAEDLNVKEAQKLIYQMDMPIHKSSISKFILLPKEKELKMKGMEISLIVMVTV